MVKVQIKKAGIVANEFTLKESRLLTVGRNPNCNITIDDPKVSRSHLTLVVSPSEVMVVDDGSANKTFMDGEALRPHESYPVFTEQEVVIADGPYSINIALEEPSAAFDEVFEQGEVAGGSQIQALLERKQQVVLGRSEEADIQLPSMQVSRKHAEITKQNGVYYITDLGSKNGTYLGGTKLTPNKATPIQNSRTRITIGNFDFFLASRNAIDTSRTGYAIIADHIEKTYPGNHIGLRPMSIKVPSKSFVALMGPSGCGKSTLLKALNFANPATSGNVFLRGIQLNRSNFNQLKRSIGYVPQDNIIHMDLTLEQTMFYAAKLRMPDDSTKADIDYKINEVLDDLGIPLGEFGKQRISSLSGGQRKRVCIAVELLNDPTLLFLDEPTSPLDPESIEDFLSRINRLKEKGVTVIMVTHKPEDLEYVDQVIFLSAGGYLTYHDEKDKMLTHFGVTRITDVYSLLKTPDSGQKWNDIWTDGRMGSSISPEEEKFTVKTESILRQTYWLTRRYLRIMMNNRKNIFLLFAQPIVIAILVGLFLAKLEPTVLFLLAISSIWFGVSNSAKEIVKEQAIYKRERMLNLNILSYVSSKIIVLSLFAIIQAFLFITTVFIFYSKGQDGDVYFAWRDLPNFSLLLFFVALPATLMGLCLSAIGKTTDWVLTFVPLLLIPQIIFSGFIAPVDQSWKEDVSFFTLGRWGVESLAQLQDDKKEAYGDYKCVCPYALDDDEDIPNFNCGKIEADYDAKVPETELMPTLPSVYVPAASDKTTCTLIPKDEPAQFVPLSAVRAINFYPRREGWKSKEKTNSLNMNLLALAIHSLVLFFGLIGIITFKQRIEEWWNARAGRQKRKRIRS